MSKAHPASQDRAFTAAPSSPSGSGPSGLQSHCAAFTPGPWAVHPVMAWVSVADDLDDKPICEMCRTARDGSEDATFANARLIAAAPCMATFVRKRAEAGDAEAIELWERINGRA